MCTLGRHSEVAHRAKDPSGGLRGLSEGAAHGRGPKPLIDKAHFSCPRNGLGSIARRQLPKDIVDMCFHGADCDVQLGGDLTIRLAGCNVAQNLDLLQGRRSKPVRRGAHQANDSVPKPVGGSG